MRDTVERILSSPINRQQVLPQEHRRLRVTFWLIAIVLGAIQAWTNRHNVYSDGISYLEIGDAYFRGDWNTAINAYWSPLYSWLLGLGMLVVNPSPYWEAAAVFRLVNFAIYVLALACFDFFLRGLIRFQRTRALTLLGDERVTLAEWAWLVLGYTLFIWSSILLIGIWRLTPDMCVAAFMYLASGILLRIHMGAVSWPTFILLGAVLGFAYLAKAAMFPLAFVFLFVSLFTVGNLRRAVPRVLIALVVFLLVCGPFILAISKAKGRLTLGDAGKLNYAWEVQGAPRWTHWQGEDPFNGTPEHPTRKVLDAPAIYEFGTPVGGSYPPWFDPSYWYEGITPPFDFTRQMKNFVFKSIYTGSVVFGAPGALYGFFLLLTAVVKRRVSKEDVLACWFLLVPALAALCMYSLVFVETRYIAPFVTVLLLGIMAGIHLPRSITSGSLLMILPVVAVTMCFDAMGRKTLEDSYVAIRELINREEAFPNEAWQVAEGLKRMGVQQGDKVAWIGDLFNTYWARLARVKIVAEIPGRYTRLGNFSSPFWINDSEQKRFWQGDAAVKSRVIQAFADTGARIIVAHDVSEEASTDGWRRIGKTDYYVYFLSNINAKSDDR